MKGLIYALMIFLAVGVASATVCEFPSVVTGQVFDNSATPVSGAAVTVNCNGFVMNDTSMTNGTYYVVYSCTECNYLDNVTVTATKGDATGTSNGEMCNAQQCFIPIALVNVTIPEFGVIAGLVALVGAVGIVAYRRK